PQNLPSKISRRVYNAPSTGSAGFQPAFFVTHTANDPSTHLSTQPLPIWTAAPRRRLSPTTPHYQTDPPPPPPTPTPPPIPSPPLRSYQSPHPALTPQNHLHPRPTYYLRPRRRDVPNPL